MKVLWDWICIPQSKPELHSSKLFPLGLEVARNFGRSGIMHSRYWGDPRVSTAECQHSQKGHPANTQQWRTSSRKASPCETRLKSDTSSNKYCWSCDLWWEEEFSTKLGVLERRNSRKAPRKTIESCCAAGKNVQVHVYVPWPLVFLSFGFISAILSSTRQNLVDVSWGFKAKSCPAFAVPN